MLGETVLGSMVFEFFTPGISQILKLAGAEYVIFDMEHAGFSISELKQQVAACRGIGVAPMVRVPRGEYQFIARALDVGAQGIMVPMVESEDEARRLVDATRYPPFGRRGAGFGFAHDDYTPGDPGAKMRTANARNLLIAQIETERGLANLDAIAAMDGIDCLWLGHFDMTNFLGIPGQFEHPTYVSALKAIVAAAKKNGKGRGFMAADAKWARQYKKLGFNMLATGTDQKILMDGVNDVLESVADK
jgi:2-keto-3-deoxy-L-rhamnonate aldolase RhmA